MLLLLAVYGLRSQPPHPYAARREPKVVSERLGHATVSITLDTYSHVLPDLQREAEAALGGILVGNWSAKR